MGPPKATGGNPGEYSSYEAEFQYEEILSESQLGILKDEFSRLKDSCYLDHAGATLYSKSQIEGAMKELQDHLFSNPHSRSPASSITTDAVDHVRQKILQHFGTTDSEYTVIFTSGTTGALKTVAESFSFNGGLFAYLEEIHTSVIGMRECVPKNTKVHCISKSAAEKLLNDNYNCASTPTTSKINGNHNHNGHINIEQEESSSKKNALVVIPAQCNFSGLKYPLSWINKIQENGLEDLLLHRETEFYIDDDDQHDFLGKRKVTSESGESRSGGGEYKWFVALDAASYVASNKLDLGGKCRPDFVGVSFYKMFGWPTGLGVLLVKKGSEDVLSEKRYFGGGTVNISIPSRNFHVKREDLHERFEDGTISFLSILGVRHGLDALTKVFPSMDHIRRRTFRLSQYFYRNLRTMKYQNGHPVARIYADTEFTSEDTQGPVVAFNLLRPNGDIVGYSEMEQIAYLHNVNLRYGCFCNPGACRRHLGLTTDDVLKHYEAGHVCGDLRDIIDGRPTGAIRVSIGYMTIKENLDFLLQLIFHCWIKPLNINHTKLLRTQLSNNGHLNSTPTLSDIPAMELSRIFVYPIKSCAPYEVKSTWTIGPHGLLYDREWLVVNSNGVPLQGKREPRLCLIQPTIDIGNRELVLKFPGYDEEVSVPLDIEQRRRHANNNKGERTASLCNSKVCGDSIVGLDCGDEVAEWLGKVLDGEDLRLIRKSPEHHRKPRNSLDEISLANQSQFLLLSMGSVRQLAKELIANEMLSSLNISINEEEEEEKSALEAVVTENLLGRFRGNLIVDSISSVSSNIEDVPYEEEGWEGLRIGGMGFKSGGPCLRCATICMDPSTGTRSSEPLLTLSRMRGGRPCFGVHLYMAKDNKNSKNSNKGPFLQTLRINDICLIEEDEEDIPSSPSDDLLTMTNNGGVDNMKRLLENID